MAAFEEFRQELQDALSHLYDPAYRPTPLLCSVIGHDVEDNLGAFQSDVIRWIERLEPDPGVPPRSRAWRDFDVLRLRFAQGLTQEETAEWMGLGRRTVQRAQGEAIHALARRMWQQRQQREQSVGREPHADQASDWRTQVEREVASLLDSAPDAVAEVEGTIREVTELSNVLISRQGLHVKPSFVQPGVHARVHPVVLRQILITAIRRLARHTPSEGEITISARLENGQVQIALTSLIAGGQRPVPAEIMGDILTPEGCSTAVDVEEEAIRLEVRLPSRGRATVLVIDDNPDIVHFYRRCTARTGYRIIASTGRERLLETVKALAPDAIVLDIMLPNSDGWQLLMGLHGDVATRAIPVIVCTVVREEELALSLGAAGYLAKPVHPRRFLEALDQVVHRDSGGGPRTRASNRAPD